jgi:acetoin utilization protein AcuB
MLTLRDVMTPSPHTIGEQQPLSTAHEIMNRHGIRHLPVLSGGRLVGLVSQRDLHLLETLRDVDPREVQVSEAMSPMPYAVEADSPLPSVARAMADQKYGSAVVMQGRDVVGVFTTVDAMRLLATVLEEAEAPATRRRARTPGRKADPAPHQPDGAAPGRTR